MKINYEDILAAMGTLESHPVLNGNGAKDDEVASHSH